MRFQEAAQDGKVRFKRDEEGKVEALIHELEYAAHGKASSDFHGDAIQNKSTPMGGTLESPK